MPEPFDPISNPAPYRVFEISPMIKLDENSIILHYYGKTKPWNTRGILNKKSKYYQNNYRLLGLGPYHITHKRRVISIRQLAYGFMTFKIFFIYKPITFLKEFFISLFR